jgi:GMP synthase-like glutamine amidotransferase
MTIGILETGFPPRALQPQFGTYADMMRTMLGPDREYRVYNVMQGELPSHPAECATYVITGSSAGVYDDLPWIPPLLDFLRAARGRAKMIGVCFGHQALAMAFGGKVEKSPKGWGLGMHRYEIVAPPPAMREPRAFAIPAFHQDQVVTLPPGAVVLAASEFTPYASLGYEGGIVSVQGHPEFSIPFSAALIKEQQALYGEAAAPALLSLLQPSDGDRAAEWLSHFLDEDGQEMPPAR